MFRKPGFCLLTLVLCTAIRSASAQTVSYDFKPGFHDSVGISLDAGSTSKGVDAGTFLASTTGIPNLPALFDAYCIDLIHDVSVPTSFGVSTLAVNNRIGWMLDNILPLDKFQAAGLQMAIWDIVFEGDSGASNSVLSGLFQITAGDPSIATYADSDLAASVGLMDNATEFHAVSHPHDDNQDIIGPAQRQAVPEPGTLSLLGAGLLGGLFVARRRASR